MSTATRPSVFLGTVVGQPVVVRLTTGVEYRGISVLDLYPAKCRGILACLDGFMNIVLEQAEEFFGGEFRGRFGDAFIRGNNGGFIRSSIV